MDRVKGKVAVVTGAALGIGKATAELLAREGAFVAVTDVLDGPGEELARAIGDRAHFWHLDVSKEEEMQKVLAEVAARWGKIDIMVNNAGISGSSKPTDEVTEQEWDALMAVNVKGVFFGTKHVIPYLRKAGGGSIINLSSIYGIIGAGDAPPYHASKGAVREMSKNDAILYARERIRVNSVHPGFIWTPMLSTYATASGHEEEIKQAFAALHPVGHIGEAMDIAWGILYLASDESTFVTGSELVIDGGYTAR